MHSPSVQQEDFIRLEEEAERLVKEVVVHPIKALAELIFQQRSLVFDSEYVSFKGLKEMEGGGVRPVC